MDLFLAFRELDTGAPAKIPLRYYKWQMAERFGWTLEYIKSLPLGEIYEWMQVEDARNKYKASLAIRK